MQVKEYPYMNTNTCTIYGYPYTFIGIQKFAVSLSKQKGSEFS